MVPVLPVLSSAPIDSGRQCLIFPPAQRHLLIPAGSASLSLAPTPGSQVPRRRPARQGVPGAPSALRYSCTCWASQPLVVTGPITGPTHPPPPIGSLLSTTAAHHRCPPPPPTTHCPPPTATKNIPPFPSSSSLPNSSLPPHLSPRRQLSSTPRNSLNWTPIIHRRYIHPTSSCPPRCSSSDVHDICCCLAPRRLHHQNVDSSLPHDNQSAIMEPSQPNDQPLWPHDRPSAGPLAQSASMPLRTASSTPVSSPGLFSPSPSRHVLHATSMSESNTPAPPPGGPFLHPLQTHKVRE